MASSGDRCYTRGSAPLTVAARPAAVHLTERAIEPSNVVATCAAQFAHLVDRLKRRRARHIEAAMPELGVETLGPGAMNATP